MTNLVKNTENTNVKTSNDLRHTIKTKDKDGNNLIIKIRLNDECKNGHQDFAITADTYKGEAQIDRNFIYGGCCHDEILKVRPDLKIFVDLHLCDYTGAPMYTVENGFYHLKNGFNNTKPNDNNFKDEFCNYYRITPYQFEILSYSENKIRYAYNLEKLGIIDQWKAQAKKAIEMLEELTDTNFLVDSKKTQYTPLTDEQKKEEDRKEAEGYYTVEQIQVRKNKKLAKQIADIKNDLAKEKDEAIKNALAEYNVKIAILEAGFNLNNFIYYQHSNEAVFNWKSYEPKITESELNTLIEFVKNGNYELPKNIVFKLDKK